MKTPLLSRRDFSVRFASFVSGLGLAGAAFGSAGGTEPAPDTGNGEVSHLREAIHQEVVFRASRKRVYDALTVAAQFDTVVQLSGAMKDMPAGAPATDISPDAGGTFTLFGGIILGRHVELVPGVRLVQAWRVNNWHPGEYSIVRFELTELGADTRLIFDHVGFPEGHGAALASGWREHYWEPMAKFLA